MLRCSNSLIRNGSSGRTRTYNPPVNSRNSVLSRYYSVGLSSRLFNRLARIPCPSSPAEHHQNPWRGGTKGGTIMADEIIKRGEGFRSLGEVLRALRTTTVSEALAIGKTGLKEGYQGIAVRGYTLVQALLEARFFQIFMDQVEEMRAAGQLRDGYEKTAAGVSSWAEFFKFIHGEPDDERFAAFCALFLSANSPDAEDSADSVDIQLMQILRQTHAPGRCNCFQQR